jgi:type I restriction enzyme M protein
MGLSGRKIAVGVAAIIYLRWLDFQDAEQEAIALFEGTESQSRLPAEARWSNWPTSGEEHLASFFAEVLVPVFADSPAFSQSVRRSVIEGLGAFNASEGGLTPDDGLRLGAAIQWVRSLRMERPLDRHAFLKAYDELLEQTQRQDPTGVQRTPADLARLMAALAEPEAGMCLYDPCFGTAQLLTAALEQGAAPSARRDPARPISSSVTGAELEPGNYLIGLVRATLAGAEDARLSLGNALERPPAGEEGGQPGADIILANPPMGLRLALDGLGQYPVQSPDSTVLFVQHVMQQLAPAGRVVVMVPQGFLYRRGKEMELRRQLGQNGWVDAVIGLPRRADASSSLVPRALLLLSKSPLSRFGAHGGW